MPQETSQHQTTVEQKKPQKTELVSNFPPVESWIQEYMTNGQSELALLLIYRVMEFELARGFQLYELLLKLDPSLKALIYRHQVFKDMAEYTGVMRKHADFFGHLLRRIRQSDLDIPKDAAESVYYVEQLTNIIRKEVSEKGKIKNLRADDDAIGRNQRYPEIVFAQLNEIDAYYTQFMDVSKLSIPDEPPPPDPGLEKWKQDIKRGLRSVAGNKFGHVEVSFGLETAITTANRITQKATESETLEDYLELDPDLKDLQHKNNLVENLLTDRSIAEELPQGATNITYFALTRVGAVFSYDLDGAKYYWVDAKPYQFDSLIRVASTKKNTALIGIRNGQHILILNNGVETPYSTINTIKFDGDNILVNFFINKFENLQDKATTYFNGIKVPEPLDTPISMQVFGDKLVVTTSKFDQGQTPPQLYVFNAHTLELLFKPPLECRNPLYINGKLYLIITGPNNSDPTLYDMEEAKMRRPLDNILLSYGSLLSHPENNGFGNRTNTLYKLFNPEGDIYIAYNPQPNLLESQAFQVNLDEYELENQPYAESIYIHKKAGPFGQKSSLTPDQEIHDLTHTKDISQRVFNCLPDTYFGVVQNKQKNTGFSLYKNDAQVYSSPNYFVGTCLAHDGNVYSIEQPKYGENSWGKYEYKVNGGSITSGERIEFLGVHYGLPVVISGNKNELKHLWFGSSLINFPPDGYKLEVVADTVHSQGHWHLAAVNTTDPLQVRELTINQEISPPESFLSRHDILFLEYAAILVRYKKLRSEQMVAEWELKQLELSDNEQEASQALAKLEKIDRAIWEIRQEAKARIYDRYHDERQSVAYLEGNWFLLEKMIKDDPSLLLTSFTSDLDSYPESLEDAFLARFFPEIIKAEIRKKIKDKVNQLLSPPRLFSNVKRLFNGQNLSNLLSASQLGQLRDETSTEKTYHGGLASKETGTTQKTLGILKNFSEHGVHNSLRYQTSESSWKALPLIPTEGNILHTTSGTSYRLFPTVTDTSQRIQLYIQPNAVLETNSITITLTNGKKHQVALNLSNNYYVIDIPPQTKEVSYSDLKKEQSLVSVNWENYSFFKQIFKQQNSEYYAGLSESFPLDPRIKQKLSQLLLLPPLEAIARCEQLCRESGYYDTEHHETSEKRKGMTHKNTLLFARQRIDELKSKKKKGIKESQYYAGVCYDSSLLLIGMLRKLGFLAGLVDEHRLEKDGSFSADSSHGSVFILWPTDTRGNYQPIYLDGTFSNENNPNRVPRTAATFLSQLSNRAITISEKELEISHESVAESKYFESDAINEDLSTPDEHRDTMNSSHKLLTSPQPETQSLHSSREKLERLSVSQLVSLTDLLIESLYAKPNEELILFRENMSTEERLGWLLEQLTQEEIKNNKSIMTTERENHIDKKVLLETILETLTNKNLYNTH